MIGIAIALAAMVAVVAVAVTVAVQANALERRTASHTHTIVHDVEKSLKRDIGAARANARSAVDAATKAIDGLKENRAEHAETHSATDARLVEIERSVKGLSDEVPPNLGSHFKVEDNEVSIAHGKGVNANFARGSFGRKGCSSYARGGGASSVLAIGDRDTARVDLAAGSSKTPVFVGANGTVFNGTAGATTINPAHDGGTVSIAERGGTAIGGFSAAGAFVKDPTGRSYVKGAAAEIGVGDGISVDASHTHPVTLRGRRVTIDAPEGLCMGERCLTPEAWRALTEPQVPEMTDDEPTPPPVPDPTPPVLHTHTDTSH